MPSTIPSTSTTARVAKVPFLNSAPYFHGFAPGNRWELSEGSPRACAVLAASGELTAALLPLIEYFRLEDTFERVGPFGIAVRGRAQSASLFSLKPIRQLDGAVISVTEESSTTAILLRLILEQKHHVAPPTYVRGPFDMAQGRVLSEVEGRGRPTEAEARLAIGDEALQLAHANTRWPFEADMGFEWWLWQHQPFVFAVWAVRRDTDAATKRELETSVARSLGQNQKRLGEIAQEAAVQLSIPAPKLEAYLKNFVYRLSAPEEEGIRTFRRLVDEHKLL